MKRNLLISLLASIISVAAIVGLLSMPHVVQAAVCTWTGATDSDWAKPSNWTGCSGVTPTLTDSIVINNTANQPIIYSGTNPSTLYALTLDSDASLRVSGTITSAAAHRRADKRSPAGWCTSKVTDPQRHVGRAERRQRPHRGPGTQRDDPDQHGVLTGAGDLLITNASLGYYSGLAVYGQYGLTGLLTLDNGTASFYIPTLLPRVILTNTYGSLSGGGGIVTVTQAMTWGGGPAEQLAIASCNLRVDGQREHAHGNLTNYGTSIGSRDGSPTVTLSTNQRVFNSRERFVPNVRQLRHVQRLERHAAGWLALSICRHDNLNGGNLAFNGSRSTAARHSGVITGSVTNYHGVVAPGHPLGALTINGHYSQYPGGTLRIDLGGVTVGVNMTLNVNGQAF
jgi:hypothetical protein